MTAAPRVALIGSVEISRRVLRAAEAAGFAGAFDFVNPVHQLPGVPNTTSIAELVEPPDLAYVAVPAERCVAVVRALAERGCPQAVVYSSGFAETGTEAGRARQQALVGAAGAMTLIGPNCYGLVDYVTGLALWPDQHGGHRLAPGERGVAIVAQSSSIAISMSMTDRVPIAHLHTVGNGACRSAYAIAADLIERAEVSAVGLLVESVSDVPALHRLAGLSRERRVPVVALVLGRSEEAARVVLSHSASLRTQAAVTSALLEKLGVGEVSGVEELIAALALLHWHGALTDARLTSLSCSGGEASLIADAASGSTVTFPPLTDGQRAALSSVLGQRVTIDNPLDYHTYIWGDEQAMTAAFEAMLTDPGDVNLFFADLPRPPCESTAWHPSLRAFATACRHRGARGAFTAAMPGNLSQLEVDAVVGKGFPILAPPSVAIAAVAAAAAIGSSWAKPPAILPPLAETHSARRVVNEHDGKRLLAQVGLEVPDALVTDDPAEVEQWASVCSGPVVVKALGLAHKSEHAGVRLNLSPGEARDATTELLALTGRVLVEEQIDDVVAELLVSIDHDPVVGAVLTLGRGGVLVELDPDLVYVVLPCRDEEIEAALARLRCYPLLTGFRERPAVHLPAVIVAIRALSELAGKTIAGAHIVSAEINPLLLTRSRAIVGDALVTIGE